MDGLMIYKETADLVNRLSDEEAGILFKAASKYAFSGEETTFDERLLDFAYTVMKRDIDRAQERYAKVCERNRVNGVKGGRPKNPVEPKETHENPLGFWETQQNPKKPTETETVTITKTVTKEKEKEREKPSGFKPPTIDDLKAYAAEKGYNQFNAERFWNFYESKNWMVGKNKMANWRSAVSNWALRDRQNTAESAKPTTDYKAQLSKLDYSALLRK